MESSASAFSEPSLSLPVSIKVGKHGLDPGTGLRLGLQPHLREDRAYVSFNSPGLIEQFIGNRLVRQTPGHTVEQFTFPMGQF